MLRYISMFVLTMFMVEANAQTPVTYTYDGNSVTLQESDDLLLVRLLNDRDSIGRDSLLAKIAQDNDFNYDSPNGLYYLLRKKTGSTKTKTQAKDYYLNSPYVGSVSFLFEHGGNRYSGITQELLAVLKPDASENDLVNEGQPLGLISYELIDPDMRAYSLYFSKTTDVLASVDLMFQTGIFESVEPNWYISMPPTSTSQSCGSAPSINDIDFPDQWGLYNAGGGIYNATPYADINVCNAWNFTDGMGQSRKAEGEGIVVAVVDDGVSTNHQDLRNNILKDVNGNVIGFDAIADAGMGLSYPTLNSDPGSPAFINSHGTKCAGIIAAVQNNSVGISGVAYKAKIMPIRIFIGTTTSVSLQKKGIDMAVSLGADVINNSWMHPPGGSVFGSALLQNAVTNAATNGRNGKGCVLVFGVGNDDQPNIGWPASHPQAIAVGGMTMCNEKKTPVSCDGANWGANYGMGLPNPLYTWQDNSNYLSVVAPATKIHTTAFDNSNGQDMYYEDDGTSMACPFVAGAAALMLSVNPCLTAMEVRDVIEKTASKVGGYSYTTPMPRANGGWNNEMGYGSLNAGDAVRRVYEMYKQDEMDAPLSPLVYASPSRIFAGSNVTNQKAPGLYTIANTVSFKAGKSISLERGFSTYFSGTTFVAEIEEVCENTDRHYLKKEPRNDVRKFLQQAVTADKRIFGVEIYPNPALDNINVSFDLLEAAQVSVSISNVLGQKFLEMTGQNAQAGHNIFRLSTANFVPGFYTISIKTDKGFSQFKFVKQ